MSNEHALYTHGITASGYYTWVLLGLSSLFGAVKMLWSLTSISVLIGK